MPLCDHFQLPLGALRTWESFHSGWANEIMRQLNKTLPPGYSPRADCLRRRGFRAFSVPVRNYSTARFQECHQESRV